MKWLFILLFLPSLSWGSGIFNPGSGGGVTAGSTNYIQNTFNPTTNTQKFSVQQGSFSATGYIMTDSAGCQWDTTINISGALVTTLRPGSCPSVVQNHPCASGMSLGILAAITCSP